MGWRRKLGATKTWLISGFVIAWLLVYNYESLRFNYLNRWLGMQLPKVKLLFPPAGWIMFYEVGDASGGAEVWAVKDNQITVLDPHAIFGTRWLGYDNIHRGVLGRVLNPAQGPAFYRYLKRKFPGYEKFAVVQVYYPSVTQQRGNKLYKVIYKCE